MLFIGGVNVAIGYWMQPTTPNPADNQRIELIIPISTYKFDAPPSDAVAPDAMLLDGVAPQQPGDASTSVNRPALSPPSLR